VQDRSTWEASCAPRRARVDHLYLSANATAPTSEGQQRPHSAPSDISSGRNTSVSRAPPRPRGPTGSSLWASKPRGRVGAVLRTRPRQ
jgi:hypothetical protein